MTVISPPATLDRDKKGASLKIMRNPDEDRKKVMYQKNWGGRLLHKAKVVSLEEKKVGIMSCSQQEIQ